MQHSATFPIPRKPATESFIGSGLGLSPSLMNRRRSDLALKKDAHPRAPGENQGRAAQPLDGATGCSQAGARLLLCGFITSTPTPDAGDSLEAL